MSVEIKQFIAEKSLPPWLATNKVLNSFEKVSKIFPSIGLPNCQEECAIDNAEVIKHSAIQLISQLKAEIYAPSYNLYHYSNSHYGRWCKATQPKRDRIGHQGALGLGVYNQLNENTFDRFISSTNGKISIKLADNVVVDGAVVFKNGESLFRVYNKLYDGMRSLRCGERILKLDTIEQFKRFSSDNLPTNKFKIVFSSDNIDGLWDIATMSMRGIASCQSWTGQYRLNLVGSMVDPFIGIIYLTSGAKANEHGSKMIRRSVVKYVINSANKKPFLLIDKMYPELDDTMLNQFKAFLINKTSGKFDVCYGPHIIGDVYDVSYFPTNTIHKKLDIKTLPYRDTKLPIGKTYKSTLANNIAAKRSKFESLFYRTSVANANGYNVDINSIPNDDVKDYVSFILTSPDFKYLISDFYRSFAKQITSKFSMSSNIYNSNEYYKRLCFYYMSNKTDLIKKPKSLFVRKLNKYFTPFNSFGVRLKSSSIECILNKISGCIDHEIKRELRALIDKKSTVIQLPN